MDFPRSILCLALLVGLLFSDNGSAQDSDIEEAPSPPNLESLNQNWWTYFEGTPEAVRPRVEEFLGKLNDVIIDLGPANQDIATAITGAVRDNLDVYVSLLGGLEIQREALPEPAERYTIEELLEIAAQAREMRATAAAAEVEVERERRVRNGASRRRDEDFKDYLDAADGDERRLAALRLVRARSALAIAEHRLRLLGQTAQYSAAFADNMEKRVEYAEERLATDAEVADLEQLVGVVVERTEAVFAAEEKQRATKIAASGLTVDTAQGRSEQRLRQQRALDAEIELAVAQIALAQAEARLAWTKLKIDAEPNLGSIGDLILTWSELVRDIRGQLPDWVAAAEEELLAVQGTDRDGLDRTSRRLLDQRFGTAQETLTHAGALDTGIADLELLMTAVENAIAGYSGALRLWLNNLSRTLKTTWLRVTDATGQTLFSVGEAPVTSSDIVQAILILLVAYALSRGIRFAVQRMGRDDSPGAQASLYTLGRLTHYTIIILAVFIALTSIGLDFTNLALVAGALSVGIGFGLQSIVNNFVSGLIILFERSLRVGDYIELDTGLTGTVKAINVRSTLINTNDNIDIVVPNSEFVANRLTNWTLGERILRVRIPFGVAYGSDKELVRKAAIEACDEVPYTLTHMKDREPDVWLVDYGDNSMNFLLLAWVNREGARRPTRTRTAYLWALEDKFRKYDIEIPFPQRDLHLRSGWPSDVVIDADRDGHKD